MLYLLLTTFLISTNALIKLEMLYHLVDPVFTGYYNNGTINYEIIPKYLDLSYSRQGQDVRYALNDEKLRGLGWEPKKNFDQELPNIIKYYKEKFIW